MGILYKNNPSLGSVNDVDVRKGMVTGYASTFNVKDSDNETILPGAFKNTINQWRDQVKKRGSGRVKMLRDHNITQLVGVPKELSEDDNGLKYTAFITQKTALGRDTLALIEDQIITEHSFGYQVFRTKDDDVDQNNTFLTELGLWEISYLAYGSNSFTPILDVKSENFQKDKERFVDYVKRVRKFIKDGQLDSKEMIDMVDIFALQLETKLESLESVEEAEPSEPVVITTHEDTAEEPEQKAHSEEILSNEQETEQETDSVEDLATKFAALIKEDLENSFNAEFQSLYQKSKEAEQGFDKEFWKL